MECNAPINRKMWPLVSVVIPMYNHARYVRRCLDSILEDGYDNLEVLLVDDGSTDNSYHIAKDWHGRKGDQLVRFELLRQENRGIAPTLNRLVRMAKGEYIAVLASDDFLLQGGVAARVKVLEENPRLLAVFGDCLVVDENEVILSESGVEDFYEFGARKRALLDHRLIGMELALRWTVPGPGFLMRRSTCDVVGNYDESMLVEDRDFYLRLLTRDALGFVDHRVACYRWHSSNLVNDSTSGDLRYYCTQVAALKASRQAKGLLKLALLLEYHKKRNSKWTQKRGLPRFAGAMKGSVLRLCWKTLNVTQTMRVLLSRWHEA